MSSRQAAGLGDLKYVFQPHQFYDSSPVHLGSFSGYTSINISWVLLVSQFILCIRIGLNYSKSVVVTEVPCF